MAIDNVSNCNRKGMTQKATRRTTDSWEKLDVRMAQYESGQSSRRSCKTMSQIFDINTQGPQFQILIP